MASLERRPATLVFLSHAGQDTDAAKDLARHLKTSGIDVWLDVERLKPGDRWMEELEKALDEASAVMVYVGPSGVRNWVDNEIRVALDKSTKDRGFRLIPVLGPGAKVEDLPLFLKQHQWQDFRKGFEGVADLKVLIAAVSGTPTEAVSVLPPGKAPFRGLLAFDTDDALLFYGREEETKELLDKLRADPFVAVVGDSGSGKSSLVRAGLIPALHRGRLHDGKAWIAKWRVAIVRPGGDPFAALAEGLPALDPELSRTERLKFVATARKQLSQGADGIRNVVAALVENYRTLIVVDQFEELFTLTTGASERARFIDVLLRAAAPSHERPVHVVIILRADFYSECWQHEDLLRRVGNNQYLVRRVHAEQLREVIEKPLALSGASAEPGLVDAVLHDVGDEPGNLPLLEHALLQLWERRKGRTLTHEGYDEIGRLSGALKKHADEVFDGLEDEREKEAARRIFLNLTQLGEGTSDTRRRTKKIDLLGVNADNVATVNVLRKLADARLVTASSGETTEGDDDVVEVAHEALIREWPRLRTWVDENRDALRIERRVLQAAKDWDDANRHRDLLLRGIRLHEGEEWAKLQKGEVAPKASELPPLGQRYPELDRALHFLEMSKKAQEEEKLSEERKRLKELRRTRTFAVIFAILFIAALGAFAWAFTAQKRAETALNQVVLRLVDQLGSYDGALVASALDQLHQDHGKPLEEVLALIPESRLAQHEWIVKVAGVLEDRTRGPGGDWAREIRKKLPALVSRAKGISPPPTRQEDELLHRRIRLEGRFQMGSPDGEGGDREHPQHGVTLSSYWIQEHEVTNREYRRFDPAHDPEARDDLPVANVSWFDAMTYAAWLGGSLPTEAQWEFAARGEKGRTYPWGNDPPNHELANYESDSTTPVKSFPRGATPEGIHDLAGNVWEWCRDGYVLYSGEEGIDPLGAWESPYRVLRGGSFDDDVKYLRSTDRLSIPPAVRLQRPRVSGGMVCCGRTESVNFVSSRLVVS